jgi:cytidylate kinase
MLGPGSIAIDGPAGSGKSTVGEQLAARLGYLYVDTGAMYRAVTWLALRDGIDITNGPALAKLAQHAEIAIGQPQVADGRQYTVTTRGEDITWAIRTAEVTRAVSTVSTHPPVRATLIAQQRAIAEQVLVVMVGRDIGAVVLPNARYKIYLTASLEERARRRYAELVQRLGPNHPDLPSLTDVISDIERRDKADRENMQPAHDAIIIETDRLSIPQVLDEVYRHLEE